MKTLKNQTLIYDQDCPLCRVYTSGFIQYGLLDERGRKPYHKISLKDKNLIDIQRASNEIALVNYESNQVIYGVDSLLEIIGFRFSLIKKIGEMRPIHFLLKKLYSFISYNRKVIIPQNSSLSKHLQCTPDYNYKYRLAYLISSVWIVSVVYNLYSDVLGISNRSALDVGLIIIGHLLFQGTLMNQFPSKIILNYLGNVMTVLLMGSILLLPILTISQVIPWSHIILPTYSLIIGATMFLEHFRRVKILELPVYLSFSWLFYFITILIITIV